MYEEILNALRKKLVLLDNIDDASVKELIYQEVSEYRREHGMSFSHCEDLMRRLFYSLRGLGILQPLLEDDEINEIMVNGYQQIFIEKHGKLMKTGLAFSSEEELMNIIRSIVSKVGRNVNTANPIVDARLEDGSRINVVLPPVSLGGAILSIRKFNRRTFTLEDYVKMESLSSKAADDLKLFVKSGYNIFISGGTSSGKTTFLNSLSMEIDADERIISIEDSAELKLYHENWIRLETRNSNSENTGQITMRDLLKTALRMRPDRIIVGEVRGIEALDMVQAMNTGHDGCLSTAHANSAKDMITRLETMILSVSNMEISSIKKQIAAAIDIMVHLDRNREGRRRVFQISELSDMIEDDISLIPLYEFSQEKGALIQTKNIVQRDFKLRQAGLYEEYIKGKAEIK